MRHRPNGGCSLLRDEGRERGKSQHLCVGGAEPIRHWTEEGISSQRIRIVAAIIGLKRLRLARTET